jgi:hypothetical protein
LLVDIAFILLLQLETAHLQQVVLEMLNIWLLLVAVEVAADKVLLGILAVLVVLVVIEVDHSVLQHKVTQ